jgi:hypothetical protein
MKWRSKPAPGAPFGQFDAQNLPNLKTIDVSIKVGRLDIPLFGTVGREVCIEEILKASCPPSQVLGSLGKVTVITFPRALSAMNTEMTLLAVRPKTLPT